MNFHALNWSAFLTWKGDSCGKRLIVDFHRLLIYNLVSRVPLGVNLLFATKLGGENYIRHESFLGPLIVAAILWAAINVLRRQFSHRTSAGEILYLHLAKEISDRTRGRNETDADGRGYDRLWNLHDDVLTKGFRSLVGSAILPSDVESKVSGTRGAPPELSFDVVSPKSL